jgi:Tfp pilus assembly protein PilF
MLRRRTLLLLLLPSLAGFLLASEGTGCVAPGSPEEYQAWEQQMKRARRLRAELAYSQAEEAFLQALKVIESPNRLDLHAADTFFELGSVYQDKRQDIQAEHCYRRALNSATRCLGPDHPVNGLFLANLLALYVQSGQLAKAERLRPRCTEFSETLGPDLPQTGRLLESLGLLSFVHGKYTEAERCFRKALAQLDKADPPDPALAIHLLSNLAIAVAHGSRSSEALPVMEQALEVAKRAYGAHCPVQVEMETAGALAVVYMAAGRDSEAEAALNRAIVLGVTAFGPAHPTVGTYLQQCSILLRHMGRKSEAKEMARRANAVLGAQARQGPASHVVDVNDLSKEKANR